jgi:WD40 repeat protein
MGVSAVAFSPDGQALAAAGWDGTLRVWAIESGEEQHVFGSHRGAVLDCTFHPNGDRLLSASQDGMLRLWRLNGEQEAPQGRDYVWDLALHPDGQSAVVAVKTGPALVYGQRELLLDRADLCTISPDGHLLLMSYAHRMASSLQMWDLATGHLRYRLHRPQTAVRSAVFSHDGGWFATGESDGRVRLWESIEGGLLGEMDGHRGDVNALAVGPFGRWLVSAAFDHTLRVWNMMRGQTERVLAGHQGVVWGCDVSPDGRWIASGSADRQVIIWDLHTGEPVYKLSGHRGWVRDVAFSPDGRWLASASRDGDLRIWDVEHGHTVVVLCGGPALHRCAWLPDGRHLLSGGEKGVNFWRIVVPDRPGG